jgi:hypothetical protein
LEPKGHETAALEHLAPGKTYHYRVIAFNAQSPSGTPGEDKTFTTQATPGEPSETCPNAKLRAEQPYGKNLPDCRAYEMVSPENTYGQDATNALVVRGADQGRAAVSGEAVTYASSGSFAEPTGAASVTQLLSRRGAGGWSTQAITPPRDALTLGLEDPFAKRDFTPNLEGWVASTNAALVPGAPGGKHPEEYGLYAFAGSPSSYRYVGPGNSENLGATDATPDLSHLLLGEREDEWAEGREVPVAVTNEGEPMIVAFGTQRESGISPGRKEAWHALSSDGSKVFMTQPVQAYAGGDSAFESAIPQIFARVNAMEPQSPIAATEVQGTGTLAQGSSTISSLVTASGVSPEELKAGSSSMPIVPAIGRFVVGDPIAGPGIPSGTTITSIAPDPSEASPRQEEVGFSQDTTVATRSATYTSEGPTPFGAGESVSGDGIPLGTTVTAVAPGALTLSNPAVSSGTGVELNEGGGCTVTGDACTIEVSASQRMAGNPAGPQAARYWGASADGSRVFFTSSAELTEDAFTGPDGNGANLYEFQLPTEAGKLGKLTDLSVDDSGNGAGVLGVTQISEDGSYVYFVAEGALAGRAVQGRPNLYVSHYGGPPSFIATLGEADSSDWSKGNSEENNFGPAVSNAVMSPDGSRLAFVSHQDLAGYDSTPAAPGDCEGKGGCAEVYLYDAGVGSLTCASCNPTGARPVGPAALPNPGEQLAHSRPRSLLADGSLFFESKDALVPHAVAGHENVYEYESGHVYAISNASGAGESRFMDVSASGGDVFFATAERLVGQDTASNVVVYDARVNGGFAAPTAPAACESGEACKPSAGAPFVSSAAPSRALTGPGNPAPRPPTVVKAKSAEQLRVEKLAKALKACRTKKNRHKRAICEKTARKSYAKKASVKKSASRANADRRNK